MGVSNKATFHMSTWNVYIHNHSTTLKACLAKNRRNWEFVGTREGGIRVWLPDTLGTWPSRTSLQIPDAPVGAAETHVFRIPDVGLGGPEISLMEDDLGAQPFHQPPQDDTRDRIAVRNLPETGRPVPAARYMIVRPDPVLCRPQYLPPYGVNAKMENEIQSVATNFVHVLGPEVPRTLSFARDGAPEPGKVSTFPFQTHRAVGP